MLATIDNLIDLSQIDDLSLRSQAVDLATIARDAAETAGTLARERQISLALTGDADVRQTTAIGDSWAVRRILDNFLANALRLTPPGGAVSINVRRSDHTVTASVSDTGRGLPPDVTEEFHEDAPVHWRQRAAGDRRCRPGAEQPAGAHHERARDGHAISLAWALRSACRCRRHRTSPIRRSLCSIRRSARAVG